MHRIFESLAISYQKSQKIFQRSSNLKKQNKKTIIKFIYKLKNITTSGFVPHAVSEHAHISVVLPKEGAAGLQTQIISLFFHLKLVCELKTRFLKDSQLINQFVSKINGLDFFLFNFFSKHYTESLNDTVYIHTRQCIYLKS